MTKSQGSLNGSFDDDDLQGLIFDMENEQGEERALSDSSSVVILNANEDDFEEGLCCMTGGEDAFDQGQNSKAEIQFNESHQLINVTDQILPKSPNFDLSVEDLAGFEPRPTNGPDERTEWQKQFPWDLEVDMANKEVFHNTEFREN
jgi:hypothetical protein